MKKIILLSLALACQSLYAAPANKPATTSKTSQVSKKADVKNSKKSEKAKPASKATTKPEAKKPASKKEVKSEKKTELAKKEKSKNSSDKHKNVAASKTDKNNDKRKIVAVSKTDKASDKRKQNASAKAENNRKNVAANKTASKKQETAANGKSDSRSSLLNHGKKFIGTPYLWGGTSPKGFDCSGLVHYIYQKQGVSIPRNSREQFSRLPVANNPQPGDLVFFRRNGVINHVGLYLGGGKMLHAPQTGAKVRIENIERPNWKRRYAGARRALKGEKTVIVASRAGKGKDKLMSDKRVAKRAQTNKEKAKVAAAVKKSKVVTARR